MANLRTFYEVVSAYFDDGRVVARMGREVLAAEKPRDSFFSRGDHDVYHDFFSSLQEAENFVKNARFA